MIPPRVIFNQNQESATPNSFGEAILKGGSDAIVTLFFSHSMLRNVLILFCRATLQRPFAVSFRIAVTPMDN